MLEIFDICHEASQALRDVYRCHDRLNLVPNNVTGEMLEYLSVPDLIRLAGTCREQRERVHDYWLQTVETFKHPPVTAEDEISRERRMIYQVVASNFLNECAKKDPEWSSKGLKLCW